MQQGSGLLFFAPLAQLDRALVYGTKGWGFELLMVHHKKDEIFIPSFFVYFHARIEEFE